MQAQAMSSAAAATSAAAAAKINGPRRAAAAAAARPALLRCRAAPKSSVAAAAADAADVPTVNFKDVEYDLPDAPIKTLLPEGAWKIIDGGVCAPKGFKAAAFKAGTTRVPSPFTTPHTFH